MLLHEGDEVSLSEQLGWAGLTIHHLYGAGLKAGALLIDREELQGAAHSGVRSLCYYTSSLASSASIGLEHDYSPCPRALFTLSLQ
jgi:hypothetical protein